MITVIILTLLIFILLTSIIFKKNNDESNDFSSISGSACKRIKSPMVAVTMGTYQFQRCGDLILDVQDGNGMSIRGVILENGVATNNSLPLYMKPSSDYEFVLLTIPNNVDSQTFYGIYGLVDANSLKRLENGVADVKMIC